VTMITANLREAAATEAIRLAKARSLVRDGDREAFARLETDGPWITVARRTGLRRILGRRALLVWRIVYEDANGRHAQSRLIPVAVQLSTAPRRPLTRAWVDAFLRALDAETRTAIDAEVADWDDEARTTAQSFISTRMAREQAIAATREADRNAFQPGLFDRRAERRHRFNADDMADFNREAVDRLAVLERSATMVLRPARLLLVVVP
jgi:hypothetical protein